MDVIEKNIKNTDGLADVPQSAMVERAADVIDLLHGEVEMSISDELLSKIIAGVESKHKDFTTNDEWIHQVKGRIARRASSQS